MNKFFKRSGYVTLPIVILFFILLLNWESLSYFALRSVARFYAGRADIDLNIGIISGNPFSQTTLGNITILPVKDVPQSFSFKAETITCTYNLRDLTGGFDFFLERLGCSVNTPEFIYDLRVATPRTEPGEKPSQYLGPVLLPALDLLNGSVVLVDSSWDAEIREINSSLRSAEGTHELLAEAKSFRLNQDGAEKIDTGFTALLSYADAKLSIGSFDLGEKEISARGFVDLAQIDQGSTGFAVDLEFAESRLNLTGSIDNNQIFKVHVRTDNFDISELQKRLGGSGWDISGKIRGESNLAYNLESKKDLSGSFAVGVLNGNLHGVDIESVSAAGSISSDIFKISNAEARTPENHISVKDVSVPITPLLKGEILPTIGQSQAHFNVEVGDVGPLLQLFRIEESTLPPVVRPNSVKMHGFLDNGTVNLKDARALTADSSLTIGEAAIPVPLTVEEFESVPIVLTARLETNDLQGVAGLFGDIPLKGQSAADISIAGSIREPKASITLSGEYLEFRKMQLGSLMLQADMQILQELPGRVKSVQFTATELTQTNSSGTLALASPISASWQQETFAIDAAFKLDGQKGVAMTIKQTPGNGIAAEITASSLGSKGWLGNFIDDRYFFQDADAEVFFTGTPGNPQLQLVGSIGEAGARDVPFPLTGSFSLHYSSKGIEISEMTWKSSKRNKLAITGFLPYDPLAQDPFLKGNLSLAGQIDFPALEDVAVFLEPWGIARGSVDLDMDLTGSWDQPQGHILLQAKGLQAPHALKQYMDSAIDITCDIIAEDDAIFLKTANLHSALYTAEAKGSWQHGFSLKGLMQGGQAELRGLVSADADVQLRDLNFLRNKIPGLRRLEGDLQAKVHVSGPINDPDVTGSFSFKDGEVRHTFSLPMLSAINLQGKLDGHSIFIRNMRLEVGGSPVELYGSITREKESVAVSLNMTGQNVLLFRDNDMRMRADVEFGITGPLERLDIKGTIGLTGSYYTRNIDFLNTIGSSAPPKSEGGGFLFSFSEPPLKDAALDIRITSIEPFRIRTNLVRGVLRPELSLRGTGELPFLTGTVYIDPTRVLLPSGRMQVESGLLRFLEGNPDRPELDLMAQSRVLNYDITVLTRGPLDDLVITLSSSPPLSNEEVMLLLLTGQPPRDDVAAGAQSSTSTNVMLYLGRDFLTRWLDDESGASDESIFDRFEMDFGRNFTKSGDQTVESSFRLSQEITGTGRKYYLTGEKDKYDAYNYGLKLVFRFE